MPNGEYFLEIGYNVDMAIVSNGRGIFDSTGDKV